MVGRGRGRGSQLTGVEQLGFGVGESMPTPVLQPPPLYPPLENRPVPLRCSPEDEYCVELRRDFIECLHDSPAYLVAQTVRSDIERYSDRYQAAVSSKSKQLPLTFPTSHLPSELRPIVKDKAKREKAKKSNTTRASSKAVDITTRLEELEKTEDQLGDAEEEEEQKESEEKDADDAEDKDEEEIEDPDEEMDDGTDYANNYFDNGEGYLDDDDDNLEDGPVY